MGKKRKNRFYAYITENGQGIVDSWPACEERVKGKRANFKGFPDRSSADAWLRSGGRSNVGGDKKYYAYRTETSEGIVTSWIDCEHEVRGRKARYRSFPSRTEAQHWLDNGAQYEDRTTVKAKALSELPEDAVFFDSGTGAGRGVELRITDREGAPLLHLAGVLPKDGTMTEEGNLLLGRNRTNNFGELLACSLALHVADHIGSQHIYGDSRLVLDYWSKGLLSREKRLDDPDLADLARQTARSRKKFEKQGGRLEYVSGGINPADLGYHRD